MASTLAPTPEQVVERPVVQQSITGRVTLAMRYWLLALADRLNRTPEIVQTVSLTGQTASLSTTTISVLSLAPGVYRLTAAARITTAATTSSSSARSPGTVPSSHPRSTLISAPKSSGARISCASGRKAFGLGSNDRAKPRWPSDRERNRPREGNRARRGAPGGARPDEPESRPG